jgi:O-antigen/teichoic acid export membrane protein
MEEAPTATNVGQPGRAGLYRRLTRSQYVLQNVIVLIATLLNGFFSYILNPVLAHLLGLEAYGKIVSLLSLLAVALMPTQIISTIVAKYASALDASSNHAKLNDLIRRLTAILLPVGIGVAVALVAASAPLATFLHLQTTDGVVVIAIALVFAFISPISGGALQGLQRFLWMSIVTIATPLGRLIFVTLLVYLGLNVSGALTGFALAAAVAYLLSLYPLRRLLGGPRISMGSMRPLWSYSATAAIALAGTIMLLNVDTILAGHFLTARQAGQYDALAVVGRTVQYVSASLAVVMFPKIVALHERGERTAGVVLQAMLAVIALSGVAEIVFVLAPGSVLRVLFHTTALAQVSGQLAWYGAAMLMLALTQVLISYFLCVGGRGFVAAVLAGCVLQLGLIFARHQSIADLVQSVVAANGFLFVALCALFLFREGGRLPGMPMARRTYS